MYPMGYKAPWSHPPRTYKFFTTTSVVFREDEPGGELVKDCKHVKTRMKSLVWGIRNPRGGEEEAGEARIRRSPTVDHL